MYICVKTFAHVSISACGSQKRVSHPLELDMGAVMWDSAGEVWVLTTGHFSSPIDFKV